MVAQLGVVERHAPESIGLSRCLPEHGFLDADQARARPVKKEAAVRQGLPPKECRGRKHAKSRRGSGVSNSMLTAKAIFS